MVNEVTLPTAVVEGDPWCMEAGELMDGLELPDMSYL